MIEAEIVFTNSRCFSTGQLLHFRRLQHRLPMMSVEITICLHAAWARPDRLLGKRLAQAAMADGHPSPSHSKVGRPAGADEPAEGRFLTKGRSNEVLTLSENAGFRRVRTVIAVYAWLACVGLVAQLLVSSGGALGYLVAALSLIVLATWWLRPQADSWSVAVLEGLAVGSAFLVLHNPQPAIAFLFGVTVRRAIRGGPHPWPMKLSLALVGYLGGFAYWSVWGMGTHDGKPEAAAIVSGVLPLLGLLITSLALYETVRAVRAVESAHVVARDARTALSAVVQASPVGLVVLDETGHPDCTTRGRGRC